MKNILKFACGTAWIVSILGFVLWDRTNANGFWWSGFVCLNAAILAGTLTSALEKNWVRVLRLVSIVGIFMNALVIEINGGRMPVMFIQAGRVVSGSWRVAVPTDHLLWLCDRFPLGSARFSAGDFVLFISLVVMLMLPKRFKV